jgi:hypothetical protein
MDDLTALLRAHCAAAQAWRVYMAAEMVSWQDTEERATWLAAERELTRVLEATQ